MNTEQYVKRRSMGRTKEFIECAICGLSMFSERFDNHLAEIHPFVVAWGEKTNAS